MKEYCRTTHVRDGELKLPSGEGWEVVSSSAVLTGNGSPANPHRIVVVIIWSRVRK